MPNERIRTCDDSVDAAIVVSWLRDGRTVAVATVNADQKPITEGAAPETNGWYLDLDRAGINRLIQLLRRARDHSFGRDE